MQDLVVCVLEGMLISSRNLLRLNLLWVRIVYDFCLLFSTWFVSGNQYFGYAERLNGSFTLTRFTGPFFVYF